MSVQPMQDPNPAARWNTNPAPQLLNPFNQTTNLPSIERWNYSPVQLASYQSSDVEDVPVALRATGNEFTGTVSIDTAAVPQQAQKPRINEGWRTD